MLDCVLPVALATYWWGNDQMGLLVAVVICSIQILVRCGYRDYKSGIIGIMPGMMFYVELGVQTISGVYDFIYVITRINGLDTKKSSLRIVGEIACYNMITEEVFMCDTLKIRNIRWRDWLGIIEVIDNIEGGKFDSASMLKQIRELYNDIKSCGSDNRQ